MVSIGVWLAVLAVSLQTVAYLVDVYALDRHVELFDLEEGELVTWTSSSATFAVALLALILGLIDPAQHVRGPVIAAGTAFISFDDAAQIHERIAVTITDAADLSDTFVQVVWPALYLPLIALVALLLVQLTREDRLARRLVLYGLGALATAVLLEVAGTALDSAGFDARSWPRRVEVTVEEGIELAGWILVATGLAVQVIGLVDRARSGVSPPDVRPS